MKKNASNGKGYEYILIFVMFVVVFGCFVAALSTIDPNKSIKQASVAPVSAFDLELEDGYEFIETEGRHGIKYYAIAKTDNGATERVNDQSTSQTKKQVTKNQETASSASVDTTTTVGVETVATTETTTETTQTTAAPTETTTTTAAPQTTDRRRVAYLTFDDGPSENTEKILDILDQYNVKATFFVIYHKNMESKYKAIVERGHTIALHSYTHSYRKIYRSEDAFFDDLTKIHDYVYSVTGVDSHIMRFPGGSSNTISNKYCKGIMDKLKPDVLERGYIYHDWNVDSTDASGNNRKPEVLLENVKARLTNQRKSNILMHDTGALKQTTVEALPSIIEYVRSQGYEMEAITEDSKVITHG